MKLTFSPLLALALCTLAACRSDEVAPPPPPPVVGSATIDSAGGTLDGPDGVQLFVPAGAVSAPVTFRISRDSEGAPELQGLNAVSPVYAVTPHGQAFEGSARLSIPLAVAARLLPVGATPLLLKAELGGQWRVMENISTDPSRLAIDLDGLSFYVLGSCTSTDAAWTINAVDCPGVDHRLQMNLHDQDGEPILRGTGANLPLWTVTDRAETIHMSALWRRPAGTNRTDQLSLVGLPGGFNSTGFRSSWTNEVIDVPPTVASFGRSFEVTIDPAQVAGASGPNGRLLRVRAYASYTTTAFRIGQGVVPVGFTFEVSIPILVRYTGPLPAIDQQPANVGVTEGQPASFAVQASITPATTLTYQWSRRADAGATFVPIPGATAAAYSLATTALTDNGAQFQVTVCVTATRCITSNAATLAVTRAPVAPVFITAPVDLSVAAGQTASFSVTASGNPLPRIDWQSAPANDPQNFTVVTGAPGCERTDPPTSGASTTATCTVGPLALIESGRRYRAVATNSATTVNSTVGTLTVNPVPVAPTITQQPQSQTTTVGGSALFSVTATGTATLQYTWQQSGVNLPSVGGDFNAGGCVGKVAYSNGGTTITLYDLEAGCSGAPVSVTVTNGINPSATSIAATLTVNPVTQSLSLLAGDIGGTGSLDGTGSAARVVLNPDNGIAVDAQGNGYFAEAISGRVRVVTPAGVVTTIAGGSTPLRNAGGVALDSSGNVYIVERSGNRIARITRGGVLTTWVQMFNLNSHIAIDAGNNLYVSSNDNGINVVSRISPVQVVTTFYAFGNSGDGIGAMVVTSDGSLYGAGLGSYFGTLVQITPSGAISILAGAPGQSGNVDGNGSAARFEGINGITIGAAGDLFVTDGRTVRRVTLAGVVTTVSGSGDTIDPRDGAGTTARYDSPGGIGAAPNGDLLIGDVSTLRRLSPQPNYFASTVAGDRLQMGNTDGVGAAARFNFASNLTLDSLGNAYVASVNGIRRVTPGGTVTTLPVPARYLAFEPGTGGLVVADTFRIWRVTTAGVATLLAGGAAGHVDGTGADAGFGQIGGLAVDAAGTVFASEASAHTIRRITPAGVVTTFAGALDEPGSTDGAATAARFSSPLDLSIDGAGNLFVADAGNLTIRRITPAGAVSTVAGTPGAIGSVDGVGAAARFRSPRRLAFDTRGNLLIGDGSTLRRMTAAGAVTTVLGVDGESAVRLGTSPRLNTIGGLAVRPDGRIVLTSEAAVLEATIP